MTQKLTDQELIAKQKEVYDRVAHISTWRHTKSEKVYHVRSVALREEDLAPMVLYARPGEWVVFARPAKEFFEKFTPLV